MPNYYGPWGTPNDTYRVWTAVSQSQSTSNNQTTVTAVAYFQDRHGYGAWDNNTLLRITIRGSKRGGDRTIELAGGASKSVNIGTGTHTITHTSSGTLSNSAVSVHVNLRNTGLYSGTASGSLSHPTIPRATTPSSGNFTTGSATTISLPRASSSFTHNVTYKVGTTTGTISSSAGTSVSWTPSDSLANRFATDSTSTSVTITVQTKSGSTVIGTKTMKKTITLGSSVKPNVNSLTISERNSLVTAAGVTGAYIQNVSKIRVVNNVNNWTTINSTQKSSKFSIGTLSANSGSEIIPATSGSSVAVSSTVTDQRNRVGKRSQNINILAYSTPTYTSASRVYRASTASGAENSSGTYLRLVLNATARSIVTSSTQRNKLFIAIRTRVNGGSWQTRTAPSPTSNTYNSTYNIPATHVTTKSHEVEVTLTDNFGGKTVVIFNVGTSIPTMDLNGFSVGIGKMHEQGALDVGGDIYQNGNRVGGYVAGAQVAPTINPLTVEPGLTVGRGMDSAAWPSNYPVLLTYRAGNPTGATTRATQIATRVDTMFFREALVNNTGWGAWNQVAMHGRNGIPYAMAVGNLSVAGGSGAVTSATVTLPVGRFSQTPNITVSGSSTVPDRLLGPATSNRSTSSFTVYLVRNNTGATGVHWQAVQMTETATDG